METCLKDGDATGVPFTQVSMLAIISAPWSLKLGGTAQYDDQTMSDRSVHRHREYNMCAVNSVAALCVIVFALLQQVHSLLFVMYLDCMTVLFRLPEVIQ